VEKKLPLGTVVALGRPKLKGITERFPVYALLPAPPTGFRQTLNIQRWKLKHKKRAWQMAAAVLAVGVVSAGTLVIKTRYFPSAPQSLPPESAATGTPALPLPDKPSLIVLPFVNMSKDSDQEYFSDGLTEVLTGDLSKISSLFVIARNSAFTYKGKAVKVQDVGREMGVRYVLEGSVLKADNQVRINAQLIDATTGGHLWSERYDRPFKGLFTLQDEIVQKIVTALKVNLIPEEQQRFKRAPTSNIDAYDSFLRGQELLLRFTQDALQEARPMYERAIALDPQYAGAYAALSLIDASLWWFQWTQDPQVLERAFASAQRAIALDDSSALAHRSLGRLYLVKKQHAQATAEMERAITLDPNNAAGYADLGFILNWAGQPEKSIGLVEQATRLDPRYPPINLVFLGQAYRLTERYEEAVSTYKKAILRNPDLLAAHAGLAVTYSMVGKDKEAQVEVEQILRLNPRYSLENSVQRIWPYKDPALLERDVAALRKAGLK
jgi:adenylate cyclase